MLGPVVGIVEATGKGCLVAPRRAAKEQAVRYVSQAERVEAVARLPRGDGRSLTADAAPEVSAGVGVRGDERCDATAGTVGAAGDPVNVLEESTPGPGRDLRLRRREAMGRRGEGSVQLALRGG
jgi:hypothetical protein